MTRCRPARPQLDLRLQSWDLARKCDFIKFPVYVSEYQMPEGFTCIGEKKKTQCLSATKSSSVIEKVFVQSHFV